MFRLFLLTTKEKFITNIVSHRKSKQTRCFALVSSDEFRQTESHWIKLANEKSIYKKNIKFAVDTTKGTLVNAHQNVFYFYN